MLPSDAAGLERLASAAVAFEVERVVVHRKTSTAAAATLRPGVRALGVDELIATL